MTVATPLPGLMSKLLAVPESVVSGTTPATPRKPREVVPKTSPETACRSTGFGMGSGMIAP